MGERDIAMIENCTYSEDEYFSTRSQIDSMDRRRVYVNGFRSGWNAATDELIKAIDKYADENLYGEKLSGAVLIYKYLLNR